MRIYMEIVLLMLLKTHRPGMVPSLSRGCALDPHHRRAASTAHTGIMGAAAKVIAVLSRGRAMGVGLREMQPYPA